MRARKTRNLVIDARPRGPGGLLAHERILGRPVLDHLLDLAGTLGPAAKAVAIHARIDEHDALRSRVEAGLNPAPVQLVTGPPPEDATILRTDRLYDPSKLRRAYRNGRDPETAVIWRLDRPLGLAGAEDELIRRRTYQPLGGYWAIGPARTLARWLRPTWVRPNGVTLASGGLVLTAAATVAFGPETWLARGVAAVALAVALVLDTADGHLARLQGTASEFGRWLDANLDELGDMALHAAIAWAAFARSGHPVWLVAGMVYAMGKYLFMVGAHLGEALEPSTPGQPALAEIAARSWLGKIRGAVIALGHADVRWHLWIVLAALGRLDLALVTYAAYFPARAAAGLARKVARHG